MVARKPLASGLQAHLSRQARDKGHQAQRHRRLHKAELRGQKTGAEAEQTGVALSGGGAFGEE